MENLFILFLPHHTQQYKDNELGKKERRKNDGIRGEEAKGNYEAYVNKLKLTHFLTKQNYF